MKTAADFAKVSANLRQLASAIQPADKDPHADARKLIQYFLNQAAQNCQNIAESLAKNEPRPAA